MPRALSDDERRVSELLAAAELPRAPARVLVLLARGGWWTAAELAGAAQLTPQDVSEAVRLLDARGVLRKEPIPRDGPGRPAMRYHWATDAKAALAGIERDARRKLERDLALLDELREKL